MKSGIGKCLNFLQSNPLIISSIKVGLSYIPIIGSVLTELFEGAVGTDADKSGQIIQILENLQILNESKLEDFSKIITENKKIFLKNNSILQNLVQQTSNIKEQINVAEKLGTINSLKIQIDVTKLQLQLVNTKGEILDQIRISEHNIINSIKKSQFSKQPLEISDNLLENANYLKSKFEYQITEFRKKVCQDYNKPPEKPNRPIISNFRKFDGAKYYVRQRYSLSRTGQSGEDVFKYLLSIIKENITKCELNNKFENQLTLKRKQLSQINLEKSILKQITVSDDVSLSKIKYTIRERAGLDKSTITNLELRDNLQAEIRQKATVLRTVRHHDENMSELNRLKNELSDIKSTERQLLDMNLTNSSVDELVERKNQLEKLTKTKLDLEDAIQTLTDLIEKLNDGVTEGTQKLERINENEEQLPIILQEISNYDKDILVKIESTDQEIEKILTARKLFVSIKNLEKKIETDQNYLVPVIGDYGSGKSALCHHVLNNLCENISMEYFPVFVPLGQLPKREASTDNLLDDIFNFIIKEYKFNLEKSEFHNLIRRGKIILILDALDEMSTRLDSVVGQTNLDNVINMAKNCVTILTSRHTYLTEKMEEKLLFIYHNNLIKILDFDVDEIDKFLKLHKGDDEKTIEQIKKSMQDTTIGQLARKPLFLNVITENFNELQKYLVINESIILKILTDEWISHDTKIKDEQDKQKKNNLINARQRISEVLAFAEYEKNSPIGIENIKSEVKEELKNDDPDSEDRLAEYYQDAIKSTFLIKEANETYRFILKPVVEYFVARRIVNDIKLGKSKSILKHAKMIRTSETFDFIKGIIEVEWAVQHHVLESIPPQTEYSALLENQNPEIKKALSLIRRIIDTLKSYSNLRGKLLDVISEVRTEQPMYNVGNLIKILHITGNLPQRVNLTELNISNTTISNAILRGANLSEANLTNSTLRGANLNNAILHKCQLDDAILVGADLVGADLTNAFLRRTNLNHASLNETILFSTDLTNANLSNTDLRQIRIRNTIFRGTNFQNTMLDGLDFSNLDLTGAILARCDLKSVKLRDAILNNADLTFASLAGQKLIQGQLRNAILIGTNLSNADLGQADLSGANLSNAILDGTNLIGAKLPISKDEAMKRGAIL